MKEGYTVRNFRKDGTEIHDLSKEVIPEDIVIYINRLFRQKRDMDRFERSQKVGS